MSSSVLKDKSFGQARTSTHTYTQTDRQTHRQTDTHTHTHTHTRSLSLSVFLLQGGRELADFEKYLADNAKSTEDEGHDEL